ncbi:MULTISPECIES: styrene monooxygenase/indole monooxygenase family protein [unclassified Streptomyces]|uniref:Styrene monooxygenase/indole monooxygenase family protein n=1 Tax=Streptomyces evansiae TaxID=3075535 RepID=A0ABU2R731_9ACTN|nr:MULTISPECIES: styrene monooxygenase/indole monooxygenase family protein [unclassified Streptomyces]EFL02621.1 oxygenase subunit [Streptomyces sp. SPB78]MDT0412491.1 styrene monooxygenase/indole monooxygenase family protein [Streptomyces sp. DSM 41979]MDT0424617.1 styrene monooxygenase/indole monooxygenase family protein [Streptomyces sp. DSM 41859]MYQ56385.1 FAD-binding oxidoreductase [Streptomyces sp. SID4926]WEH29796.1 FAD-binding oxidoreductase [Streptomyces sp. AM 3-1-1]
MRKVLIVGAGQSGLQIALGLQSHGYEVTLMSNRTADEIRSGRVMSTQCMFHTALQHERDLELNFWENQAPRIAGLGVSVAAPDSSRAVDWVGRLDGFAQSVDQRVKMAGWMETFAQRGGQVVIHGAAVGDLDYFSRTYDLVLVAAGKGELVSMFERDASRSVFDAPQRALAVAYVHGLGPRPEHPDFDAVRCNLVPGVGELFVMPTFTNTGRADILFWEGVPGGPLDAFKGVKDPSEHLALTLELMEKFVPWEYARATKVELTDANGTLAGRYAPTVRKPIGRLPGGGAVLGVADVVVANDPITGQGSNSASKCAASYLSAIVEHGDRPFDEAWMQSAFDRYWDTAQHVVKWTNAMLGVPPEHVLNLIGAAGQSQPVADRFANGFNDPADFENFFYDPEKTAAYLESVQTAA